MKGGVVYKDKLAGTPVRTRKEKEVGVPHPAFFWRGWDFNI